MNGARLKPKGDIRLPWRIEASCSRPLVFLWQGEPGPCRGLLWSLLRVWEEPSALQTVVTPISLRASLPAWRYVEEDAVEHITPLWVRFKFKPQSVVQILSIQTVFCLVFQLGNTFRASYYRFGPNLRGANLRQFTLTAAELLQTDLCIIRSRGALLCFLAKKCSL